jgi:hypothetical protein
MNIKKLAATLLNVRRLIALAGLLTLMAGPALAIPPGTDPPECADLVSSACTTQLEALCAATDAAGSLKDRDRNTLVSKVLGAGIKLTQGKVDQADEKLGDYESKLDQLIATQASPGKEKINDDDADALTLALITAQGCVDSL